MTRSVAIIGLGLMGGSLARDLAARGVRVLGYDRDTATLDTARKEGVLDVAMSADLHEAAEADIIVLAVPVSVAAAVLTVAAPHLKRARLITDLGSTKRAIVYVAERLGLSDRFVGGHPLTGDHRSGWSASHAGLYDGAAVFLCPTARTSAEALACAHEFWAGLQAHCEEISAEEHDQRLAHASHLPQIIATALALVLNDQNLHTEQLGPGGRAMTRLAGSDPDMWTSIALDNRSAIVKAIVQLERRLAAARAAVADGDPDAVRTFFNAGRAWSDA
jgi:prephenate dehydrogenase